MPRRTLSRHLMQKYRAALLHWPISAHTSSAMSGAGSTGGKPPRMSRDLLVRAIAYRKQELAHGGISKATHRKLTALARELKATGSLVCGRDRKIRPSAQLAREW